MMSFGISFFPTGWTPQPWQGQLLSLIVLVWMGSEVLYRLKGGIRSPEDSKSSEAIGAAMLANMLILPLLAATRIGHVETAAFGLSVLGLGLAGGGTALRYWAILTLGRYFTSAVMIQPDQSLIQRGPFRLLRHPGYTGVLLFGMGIGLTFANPLGSVWFLVTQGAALVYRIRVEEAVLRHSFGTAFDTYAERTWKLVPFVY